MTEFCTKTNSIINTIQYTPYIQPVRQFCCKYNQKIYIIDGEQGEITLFNPSTKTFIKLLNIPKIGTYPGAVVMHNKMHIFHGSRNNDHLIYNLDNNTLRVIQDATVINGKMRQVHVTKYGDRLIRFAGRNTSSHESVGTFMISSEIKPDQDDKDITWSIKDEYDMDEPRLKCGIVVYKHWLLTFGGEGHKDGFKPDGYIDNIYLLDLKGNDGWIELEHVKCPIKSRYYAILDDNNMVHLITGVNKWPDWRKSMTGHYSIPISTLLGSRFGVGDNKQN